MYLKYYLKELENRTNVKYSWYRYFTTTKTNCLYMEVM